MATDNLVRDEASSFNRKRAKVAALSRDRTPDDPELVQARLELDEARRELAVARLKEYAREVVSWAPPLSVEERRDLVAIFTGAEDQ